MRFSAFGQSSSGREQRLQFAYFEVPAGQGNYAWIDYNGNGVQEINEFEQTPFRDQARFIRMLIPTADFIRSRNNELNLNAELFHPQAASSASFVSRLNSSHTYQANQRNTDARLLPSLLPFALRLEDARYLSGQSLERHTLWYNRNRGKIGADYSRQVITSKYLIANGNDWKHNQRHFLTLRWSPDERWQINTFGEAGKVASYSDFNVINRYAYGFDKTEMRVSHLFGRQTRVTVSLDRRAYQETAAKRKLGNMQEAMAEAQIGIKRTGFLEARVQYSRVAYHADPLTALAYDILQGLQPGDNFRWSTGIRMKAGKSVQLDFGYEGRNIPGNRSIHNGRAEARYLF
jgi:hypothetical protein